MDRQPNRPCSRHPQKPLEKQYFGLAVPLKISNPPIVMSRYLPLVLTIGLLIAFRVMGSLAPEAFPNFQPLVALFFCGALMAPGWKGFAIPAGIWAITYPLGIGPIYNVSIFVTTLIGLGAAFFIGKALSNRGLVALMAGSLVAAFAFHLITCTAAWLGDPLLYAKTPLGFWQSVWAGPEGSTIPSWVFFRNLAAANVLFTGIFVGAQLRLPKSKEASVISSNASVSAK